MALVGAGTTFTLDAYVSASNTAGSAQALGRVTDFSGVDVEGITVDGTALEDAIEHYIATGQMRIGTLTLSGIYDSGSSGAYARIGPVALRADYPARTLTITYVSGVTQALEVMPMRRKIMPAVKDVARWEADFQIVGGSSSSFTDIS